MKIKERKLNLNYDLEPSYAHVFHFHFTKPYIKNRRILDIGCWSGQYEKLAYEFTEKFFAIDPNPQAISQAKKNLPKVSFQTARANKLPFSNSSFDVVCLLDVLEHIPKSEIASSLEEIRRVLKKGGRLILSTPNKHILSILFDPAFFILSHRHYSIRDIIDLLNPTNFKITKIRKVGNLFNCIFADLSLAFKYLHLPPPNPKYFNKSLLYEYKKNGFMNLLVVAVKK